MFGALSGLCEVVSKDDEPAEKYGAAPVFGARRHDWHACGMWGLLGTSGDY